MQKLYEVFKGLKVQKRIVSAETIRGELNMLSSELTFLYMSLYSPTSQKKSPTISWHDYNMHE